MTDIQHLLGPDAAAQLASIKQTKITLPIGGNKVVIDHSLLEFDETTLNGFMERVAIWYSYYSQQLAEAEYLVSRREQEYDLAYSRKFDEAKAEGCSDNLAKARAIMDSDVQEAQKNQDQAKVIMQKLKHYLKAWDMAHDNAHNRGHFLRKEMEKLGAEIYSRNKELDDRVDHIVRGGK